MRSTAARRELSLAGPGISASLRFALLGALVIGFGGGCGDDGSDSSAASATDGSSSSTGTDSDSATESGTESGTDSDSDSGSSSETGAVDEGPWDNLDERPCPSDSFLTYENFGGPFINSNCTGCHHSALSDGERQNAPPGFDFETVALIRTHADRIWARSGDDNATMPPAGPPEAEERALLGEWLACGAPAADDLME